MTVGLPKDERIAAIFLKLKNKQTKKPENPSKLSLRMWCNLSGKMRKAHRKEKATDHP